MNKFHYDLNDKKTVFVGGRKIEHFRIVADRDINNPYKKIKKGEKGGYIVMNTLPQDGECWVNEKSVVGEGCFVCCDAYIDSSTLARNVRVEGYSKIINSKFYSKSNCSIGGEAIVVQSKVLGSINISETSRIDTSTVFSGHLSMEGGSSIFDCDIYSKEEGIKMFDGYAYSNKIIKGAGVPYGDRATCEDKYKFDAKMFKNREVFETENK